MQRPTPNVQALPTVEAAAEALAELIVRVSDIAMRDRGQCSVALSGGSTPRVLYETLASAPYVDMIDWPRWQLFWSDERCVPPEHADSNYGMAKRTLLDHVAIPDDRIHRVRGEIDADAAADAYEAELRAYVGPLPVFDLILLGLGEDGHTASLFPESLALEERRRLVVAADVPDGGVRRVTFTLPLINAARHVAFFVAGASKAGVVASVFGAASPNAVLPASLVQPTDGRLHWFLAADATPGLRA